MQNTATLNHLEQLAKVVLMKTPNHDLEQPVSRKRKGGLLYETFSDNSQIVTNAEGLVVGWGEAILVSSERPCTKTSSPEDPTSS